MASPRSKSTLRCTSFASSNAQLQSVEMPNLQFPFANNFLEAFGSVGFKDSKKESALFPVILLQ